jgi:hypothetical protein
VSKHCADEFTSFSYENAKPNNPYTPELTYFNNFHQNYANFKTINKEFD